MILSDVIPDSDFRHSMRFSRAPLGRFYGKTDDHDDLIAQRTRWIEECPGRHAVLLSEGEPLLQETAVLAAAAGGLSEETLADVSNRSDPKAGCRMLGAAWEPDFVLMKFTGDGLPRLLGGSVCFPSGWCLEEKLGKTMEEIHAVVPALNAELNRQISGFLARIKPEVSWERSNWGLAATPELNLHPARQLPKLRDDVGASDVWLRIEWQSLAALPFSGGILFGIRLQIVPLTTVMEDTEVSRRLRRALVTMPPDMASYKGLSACRETLIRMLPA